MNLRKMLQKLRPTKPDRVHTSTTPYPIADNVTVGSIVVTKFCWSIGIVGEVYQGEPVTVYGMYDKYDRECSRFGPGNEWYDTGFHMTWREWEKLCVDVEDAKGFHQYWGYRLQTDGWPRE